VKIEPIRRVYIALVLGLFCLTSHSMYHTLFTLAVEGLALVRHRPATGLHGAARLYRAPRHDASAG